MNEEEWRELSRLAWNAATCKTAKDRGWVGALMEVGNDADKEANRLTGERQKRELAYTEAIRAIDRLSHSADGGRG